MRKGCKRKERIARIDTMSLAKQSMSYLGQDEIETRLGYMTRSLQSIFDGTATDVEWGDIAACYNVVMVLAKQRGVLAGQPLQFCAVVAQTIEQSYAAYRTSHQLPQDSEREILLALVNLFAQVLESVPQRLISSAELAANKRITTGSGVSDLRLG